MIKQQTRVYLKNHSGMVAAITNYGGRIVSLLVPIKAENEMMWSLALKVYRTM